MSDDSQAEINAAVDAAQTTADAIDRQTDAGLASREATEQSDAQRDMERYPVI
jgi:hypothetical protein